MNSFKTMFSMFVLISLMAGSAVAGSRKCDGLGCPQMIEVGAGGEMATGDSGMNLLVRISLGRDSFDKSEEFYMRVRGEVALSMDENGDSLPYLSFEFSPFISELNPGEDDTWKDLPEETAMNFQMMATELTRDVRLGQELNITLTPIRAELGMALKDYGKAVSFVKLAVDALALKYVRHGDAMERQNWGGMQVLGIKAEGGVVAGNEKVRVRLSMGGEANIGLGRISDLEWSMQSDHSLYAQIRADLKDFMDVFVRGSVGGAYDDATGERGVAQLMVGAEFIF